MPVDLQPTLRGSLVELRPLRADDWTALYAVASDPLLWAQHPASDRYQEDVFKEFFRVALESRSALIAIDAKDGTVIGSSRYHGYDDVARAIEIGWTFLARSHWGGRHNGQMKQLMLDHAFQFADRVIFAIGPQNIRSRRAIERIGGVLIGSRVVGGQESVVYAIDSQRIAG
ncbi:GNAT family protein [soil metagenome]